MVSFFQTNDMDFAQLPEDTDLYQLLKKCNLDHEIELSVCADGALIMRCFVCPFHRVLDAREEEYFRAQNADL
jgi:hypothetical protein